MFKKVHLPQIDSTHKWAEREIHSGLREPLCVTTDEQTAGIGRKGHTWRSTSGQNLLATFVFPLGQIEHLSNLAQLLSFSAIKVLEQFAIEPQFKWPNDILIAHKKLAGVMVTIHDTMVIASIGMNVNMDKMHLDQIDSPATSLKEELHQTFSLPALLGDLIERFTHDLALFRQKGFTPFYLSFNSKLAFIGKAAQVGSHLGTIVGLHQDGRLVLDCDGKRELLSDGSLTLL